MPTGGWYDHERRAGAARGSTAGAATRRIRCQVDRRVRVLDEGSALLGGSPTRLLRLAPAARTLLSGGRLEVRDATSAQLARTLLDATVAHPARWAGPATVT